MTATPHVLALNASRQKRNTYTLIAQIADLLRPQGIDVEIVNLHDFDIADCLGCLRCLHEGVTCAQKDDLPALLPRIKAADGLILGTPVHMATLSGKLKTLLDRLFLQVHRPELAGKPLLSVAATGGSGLKSAHAVIEEAGLMTGMYLCGRVSRRSFEMHQPVQVKEVAKFAHALLGGQASHRPALRQIMYFNIVRGMGLNFEPLDRQFWTSRGMAAADYYYPCQMGPLHRAYGRLFGALMRFSMRRFAKAG